MWEGPAHCDVATPGQVVLRCASRHGEQGSKQQPLLFYLSFCLQVPALCSCSAYPRDGLLAERRKLNKPFPPCCFCSRCFTTALTETGRGREWMLSSNGCGAAVTNLVAQHCEYPRSYCPVHFKQRSDTVSECTLGNLLYF